MFCANCVHRIRIPGNRHIGCNNDAAVAVRKVWPGCGIFPLKFDPNTVVDCNGFSDKEEDRLPADTNPLIELARLLS